MLHATCVKAALLNDTVTATYYENVTEVVGDNKLFGLKVVYRTAVIAKLTVILHAVVRIVGVSLLIAGHPTNNSQYATIAYILNLLDISILLACVPSGGMR